MTRTSPLPPCTCGHLRRAHSKPQGKHWCHSCETECIYCPTEEAAPPQQGALDATRQEVLLDVESVINGMHIDDEIQDDHIRGFNNALEQVITELRRMVDPNFAETWQCPRSDEHKPHMWTWRNEGVDCPGRQQ